MRGNGNFTVESCNHEIPIRIELIPNKSFDGMVNIFANIGNGAIVHIGFFRDGALSLSRLNEATAKRMGIKRDIAKGHILINNID